jgi:hypothetical protein
MEESSVRVRRSMPTELSRQGSFVDPKSNARSSFRGWHWQREAHHSLVSVPSQPEICPHGPPPPPDLIGWERAWEERPSLGFRQAWIPENEAHFLPGRVQTGWSDQGWHVLAVLQDHDIFNHARTLREPSWETGDVFEIFLRPEGQESYYEIHITPENFGIRLRFPSGAFFHFMSKAYPPGHPWPHDHFHNPPGLETRALVQHDRKRWLAGATLPFASVLENGDTTPTRPWRVSFCRYDCTRGRNDAVLSSTSPLPIKKFHPQEHWGSLRFNRP